MQREIEILEQMVLAPKFKNRDLRQVAETKLLKILPLSCLSFIHKTTLYFSVYKCCVLY